MKLLCDEMLARLGRWLRAAGYDTLIAANKTDDRDLLETARADGRVLVTRDRALAGRGKGRVRSVLLEGDGVTAQADELRRRLGIDWWRDPFSRCVVDNTPLEAALPPETDGIPRAARARGGPFSTCPTCGRLYWEGSHHKRMAARLKGWQGIQG